MTEEMKPEPPLLPRMRITAATRRNPDSAAPVDRDPRIPDASAVYLRTLVRAQLKLAIVIGVSFAASLAAASFAIATIPVLQVATIVGVPWSWALQAYGIYPLVAVFAFVYVRAAGRNEQRYRSLEHRR